MVRKCRRSPFSLYVRAVKSQLFRKHRWPTAKVNAWAKENKDYLFYMYSGEEEIQKVALLVDNNEG